MNAPVVVPGTRSETEMERVRTLWMGYSGLAVILVVGCLFLFLCLPWLASGSILLVGLFCLFSFWIASVAWLFAGILKECRRATP